MYYKYVYVVECIINMYSRMMLCRYITYSLLMLKNLRVVDRKIRVGWGRAGQGRAGNTALDSIRHSFSARCMDSTVYYTIDSISSLYHLPSLSSFSHIVLVAA